MVQPGYIGHCFLLKFISCCFEKFLKFWLCQNLVDGWSPSFLLHPAVKSPDYSGLELEEANSCVPHARAVYLVICKSGSLTEDCTSMPIPSIFHRIFS